MRRTEIEPREFRLHAEVGTHEIGVETVRNVRDVEALALDMGESLGAVGSAVAQRSAVEGFEFKVAQTVEGEHSEDTECANAEVAGECGDGARAEVVDQVGDAHAAEEGEREEAGGWGGVEREETAEERPTPRAGGASGEVTQRKIAILN